MDIIDEKLARFKLDCLENAIQDAGNLEVKIKEEIEKQVKEELKSYNIKQELKFNRELKNLEKDFHARFYLLDIEAKQKIIEKQQEIQENFKEELQTKINIFVRK